MKAAIIRIWFKKRNSLICDITFNLCESSRINGKQFICFERGKFPASAWHYLISQVTQPLRADPKPKTGSCKVDIQVNFNDSEHPSLGTSRTAIKLELQKYWAQPAPASSPPTHPTLPLTETCLVHYCPKLCFYCPISILLKMLSTSLLLQPGLYVCFMHYTSSIKNLSCPPQSTLMDPLENW